MADVNNGGIRLQQQPLGPLRIFLGRRGTRPIHPAESCYFHAAAAHRLKIVPEKAKTRLKENL